jgi:hypothetical protein
VKYVSLGLFVVSYVLAVLDGAVAGAYSQGELSGRAPKIAYVRKHRALLLSAAIGIAAATIGILG